jgi:hypothetical protein
MKKIALAVCVLFCFLQLKAQVDTSVIYIDWSGNINTKKTYDTKYLRKAHLKDKWCVRDYYIESGNLQMTGNYLDDAFEIEHDTFIFYYENGSISQRGTYKNGNKIGVWNMWFDDGKLDNKCTYKDNDIKKCVYYHYNGEVSAVAEYQHDTIILSARMWDSTGMPSTNEYLIIPPTLYGYENGWKKFMSENIGYPEDEKGNPIESDINFRVKIDRFGKVHWVDVIGFAHPILALDMENLFKKMPLWTPAILQNRAVDYILRVKLTFNIED